MIKKILLILLFLILFVPVNIKAEIKGYYERVENTGYGYSTYGNKTSVYFLNKDIYNDTISFAKLQVYYIEDDGFYETFCFEPGTIAYNNGVFIKYNYGSTIPSEYTKLSYLKLDLARKDLIRKILTYSHPLASPLSSGNTRFTAKQTFINAVNAMEYPSSTSEYRAALARIIATQGLIWEVVTTERTTFNSYVADRVNSIHGATNTSFCSAFVQGVGCGVNNTSPADNTAVSQEYKWLVDMASVDGVYPSRFDNGVTPLKLNYDSETKKYVGQVLVSNNSFKRCVAKSPTNGRECIISTNDSNVSVTVNSNNLITIKSNRFISSTSPVTITYEKRQSSGTTINWYEKAGTVQGIARSLPGTPVEKTLSVYTQPFGIQVLKTDLLTGNTIQNVRFNVYSNSACTGTAIATGITGEDGIVEFKNLQTAEKVYVKEDASTYPEGYKINSACTGVWPSNDPNNLTELEVKEEATKLIINKYDERLKLITSSNAVFIITEKESGDLMYFTGGNGEYTYSETEQGATNELETKNGTFTILYLPIGSYELTEIEAPDDYSLPEDPTIDISLGSTDNTVKIINGITGGIIFEKVNEEGAYLSGGVFSLQRKLNNLYTDVLLEEADTGVYEYTDEESETSTAVFGTSEGLAILTGLPTGVYRIVEKQAPEGYDLISEDGSPRFTILDIGDNNIVRMIDLTTTTTATDDSATLIIAISTGRDIRNYFLIISCIVVGLGATIFIKKKTK